MKTVVEIKRIVSSSKPMLIEKYAVKEIGVFGSWVRGEQRPQSDIDILVDFEEYPSLLEFIDMEDKLSECLGAKVDLVMRTGLKPYIGRHILREVIYL